jgi:hypothetical protein
MLAVRFDRVHKFFALNAPARRRTVAVVLASSVAGAQAIGGAVDPAPDGAVWRPA